MTRNISKILQFSLLIFLSFITPLITNGQQGDFSSRTVSSGNNSVVGSISGKLIDGKNEPVSFATVTLLKKDSSVLGGDLSKDDGTFSVSISGAGIYILRVEALGVKTKFFKVNVSTDSPNVNLGKIKIVSSDRTLKEVSIVSEKAAMELKADKKVFNVEKNATSAGGSASDVLQNVPSVSVDQDGNVSLRGKSNVTILIDGKPATMLGSDVASALQSLPASSIESVEVITNPSAKYDAQGTTGIVNIVLKKDGRLGINGNLTGGVGTGDKYNGNFGLNVRKGKWNAFVNSGIRYHQTYNNVITDRYDDSVTAASGVKQSYHTYEHVPRHHNGIFNTIGASWDPNKYNSLTFTQNVNIMEFGFNDFSNFNVYKNLNEEGASIQRQDRYTDFAVNLLSFSSSLDYKKKFKKKDEELSMDASFSTTGVRRRQNYSTTNYDSMMNPLAPIQQMSPATGSNNNFNAWADYSDPLFTKNGKLGLGFKSTVNWFISNNSPVRMINNTPTFDSSLVSDFKYTMQTHAAYINWSDQIGKFTYQAGLRAEDAFYNGSGNTPTYSVFKNDFFNFFPSAFVSYQLPAQQSIYLNYSRRTNRPGFMQLLPFKDLSNPGTVNTGNPGLIPEFINNLEFSYNKSTNKGHNFILSVYYAHTENLTQKITRPISDSEALLYNVPSSNLFAQPINIASGTTYGLEGTGRFQLFQWWDATLNFNYFINQLEIGNGNPEYTKYLSNNSGNSWFGKFNTSIKLPKSFSLQLNGNYESAKVIAQGNLKETYWVDVAVKKNFWNNKATLTVNCQDVFKTHTLVTNYTLTNYHETINRIRETRIGNITFTWRFGKMDIDKKGPGAMGGGDKRSKKMDGKKPTPPNDEEREKNLKESDDNDQGGGPGGQKMKDGNKDK